MTNKRQAAVMIGLLLFAAPRALAQEEEPAPAVEPVPEEGPSQGQHTVEGGTPDAGAPPPSNAPAPASKRDLTPKGSSGSSRNNGGVVALPGGLRADVSCRPLYAHRPAEDKGKPGIADIVWASMGPSRSSVARSVLRVGRYLYVSGEPGLQTIDVFNPERMVMTADWSPSSAKMNGAATKGGVLYVTNWHPGDGLVLFDLARPSKPVHIKTIATPNFSWAAEVTGDLLDVTVGNETKSAIVTYDIKDPRNPKLIGSIDIARRLLGNATRRGDYLYFTQDNFLYVYEASDPARPKRVAELAFNTLCGKTKIRGNYLYMLERKVLEKQEGGVRVFSLDNPASPRSVGFWAEDEPKDIYFQGNLAVVPSGGDRVHTLDVSSPANPRVVGMVGVGWPGTGQGGYPVTADGADGYAFIGATGGNNPTCADASCACYGARVYSMKLAK